MAKKRVISGIAIFLLFLLFVWLSGPALAIFMLLISIAGMTEITKATGVRAKDKKYPNGLEWIAIITSVAYYAVMVFVGDFMYLLMVLVVGFLIMMLAYALRFPKYEAKQVAFTIFSLIYVPVMISFFYLTRIMEEPFHVVCLAWTTIIIAWLTDTFAYLVGSKLGKHKLAPKLSPKKSIEGSIGGIVGAAVCNGLFGCLYLYVTKQDMTRVWLFILIAAIGAVFAQIGDLAASAIKRNYNIKDYSNLIPGHGGIIDRFDSFIVTAPMVYFLFHFLFKI